MKKIYCVYCGCENDIKSSKCSNCKKELNPKEHPLRDYLYNHIKDNLQSSVTDKFSSLVTNYIKSHWYGIIMTIAVISAAVSGVVTVVNNGNQDIEKVSERPIAETQKEEIVTFTVSFDSDGGSIVNEQIIEENSVVVFPNNPVREDYTFVEWQLDGNAYDFSSVVDKDITLKAIWEKKCTSKKFEHKFTYAYKDKDTCEHRGNEAFLDISDNINPEVFAYKCVEIIDECGDMYWGAYFYTWDYENNKEIINYY